MMNIREVCYIVHIADINPLTIRINSNSSNIDTKENQTGVLEPYE